MKHRVIESADGRYYPQWKPGLFRRWHLFARDADTSAWILEIAILTLDPEEAAHFDTPEDAEAFIDRVVKKVRDIRFDRLAKSLREEKGVRVHRVVKRNGV